MSQVSISIPPLSRGFFIRESDKQLLAIVQQASVQGRIVNVMVTGPQGSGKSELVTTFAASNKRPLAIIEVGEHSDPRDFFGRMEAENGSTRFVKGLFTEAITTPRCVVHLQEINRAENDRTLNAIFSVLDDTSNRSIWIDEIGEVKVAPGVTFFATLNQGYEFVGTQHLDAAMSDRFKFKIRLPYPDRETTVKILVTRLGMDSEKALRLAALAESIRASETPFSMRSILALGELLLSSMPLRNAVTYVVDIEDKDKLENILLSLHFTSNEAGTWGGSIPYTYSLL